MSGKASLHFSDSASKFCTVFKNSEWLVTLVALCCNVCVSMRRQYVPLSLLSLQRMVDLGRIDVMQPIDLTAICNTSVVAVDPTKNHYGINLTDEVCTAIC